MPPVRFGRYTLVARLGQGGMAELFMARMEGAQGFEKIVALKRILPHLASDRPFADMFLDEARLVARINHPNVVQVFDFGEEGRTLYLAMEYLAGADLSAVSKRYARQGTVMPIGDVLYVVAQAALGLNAAHGLVDAEGRSLGLVHRDVSPQNLFITFDGTVKVLDFGVARAAGRLTSSQVGTVKGKLAYMAPEHARGEDIDHRADLYALGIVLWELLTGTPLFHADSQVALLAKVINPVIPEVKTLRPEVPAAVADVVRRALALNPSDRFESGEELALALEAASRSAGLAISPTLLGKSLRELLPERFGKSRELLDLAARGGTSDVLEVDLGAPRPSETETLFGKGSGASKLEPAFAPQGFLREDGRLTGVQGPEAAPAPAAASKEADDAPLELDEEKLAHARAFVRSDPDKLIEGLSLPTVKLRYVRPGLVTLAALTALGGAWYFLDPRAPSVDEAAKGVAAAKESARAAAEGAKKVIGQGVVPALQGKNTAPRPHLTVDSEPSGAEITLGSEVLGTTPWAGDNVYPAGEYRLMLRLKGYAPQEARFEGGTDASVTVRLKRR